MIRRMNRPSSCFLATEPKGVKMEITVPIWIKYTLSIEETAAYFRIGENKIRRIISEDRNADFILWNGNRPQIKRQKFESYINSLHNI